MNARFAAHEHHETEQKAPLPIRHRAGLSWAIEHLFLEGSHPDYPGLQDLDIHGGITEYERDEHGNPREIGEAISKSGGLISERARRLLEENITAYNFWKSPIQRLNQVYERSLSLLEDATLIPVHAGVPRKHWTSLKEFWDTMAALLISGDKSLGRSIADILKGLKIALQILDNPQIKQLRAQREDILRHLQHMPGMSLRERKNEKGIYDFEIDGSEKLRKKHPHIPNRRMRGTFSWRLKDEVDMFRKLVYKYKYTSVDIIKDCFGTRYELSEDEQSITGAREGRAMLVQYLSRYQTDTRDTTVTFGQKGAFLDPTHLHGVRGLEIDTGLVDPNVGENYCSADITGQMSYRQKNGNTWLSVMPGETQFYGTNHANESGYNSHYIYDLKKVLTVNARFRGFITPTQVEIAFRAFEKYLPKKPKDVLRWMIWETGYLKPMEQNGELVFVTQNSYKKELGELYDNYPAAIAPASNQFWWADQLDQWTANEAVYLNDQRLDQWFTNTLSKNKSTRYRGIIDFARNRVQEIYSQKGT